ncbi:MAG TPA: hypothetical protein EYN91_18985 [Candidatus Melainabacteria bacterium]|jgi:hypothetical protein|nr:hypothetical protein [Candidatus Melainabacteria bacterium]HIA54142.1 hypothetical protein [Candidatus Melainabacteria bacterium]HIN63057.1 hypothetical protein [Candidatus Obscuribacterales bacterium]
MVREKLLKMPESARRFRSGTTAMLICLVLIVGYQVSQPQKVRIERRVEPSGEGLPKRLPAVSLLLQWQKKLGLRDEQVKMLGDLDSQEKAELKPIEESLSEITSMMKSNGSPAELHMNISQIQALAKEAAEPSRRKREIVSRFSKQAWQVLESQQQSLATKLSFGSSEK